MIIVDIFGIMSLAYRVRAITVRLWNSSPVKTVNQSITIHHILNRGQRGGGVKSWTELRGVNFLEKEETGALLQGNI